MFIIKNKSHGDFKILYSVVLQRGQMNIICIDFKIKGKKAIKTTINTDITEKKRKLHKRKNNILVTVY